jgi:hypothetical protein
MIDDFGDIAVDVVAEVIDAALPESSKRSWRKILVRLFAVVVVIGMAIWYFS